jgi:hypothetical protein
MVLLKAIANFGKWAPADINPAPFVLTERADRLSE